jgi:DNA-binding CsgD family transcriptional regulator
MDGVGAQIAGGARRLGTCIAGTIVGRGDMSDRVIGRDAELAMLRRLIEGIEDEGSSVVVRGPAGVGKSTVLRAAADLARRGGALVLEASGIESEAMLPFVGLHQLLAPLVSQLDTLPTVQRQALATAFGVRDGPRPELFLTALAALTLVVDAAASQPIVLLVDDVQWLDSASMDVLAFVSRRLRQDPVILISGLRDGYAVALNSADALEISLAGLDSTSSRELLATVADGLTVADQHEVLRHAEGNPLALVELPTAWSAAGWDTAASASATVPLTTRLVQAFAARIPELPAATHDALLVAAVNAEDSLAEILEAAAVLSGGDVTTEDLEPAVKLRLLELDQVRVRFRHPLVRAAVLSHAPVARRQAAHAALSEVLQAEPYRRVWHQALSVDGPDDDVAARLEAGHSESMRRGSVMSAIAALERAAQLTSAPGARARRLLLAAQHAFGLGREHLVDRLLRAAEADDLCEADRARAEWLHELFSEGELGNSERVRELCTLAARSATSGDDDLALDLLASAALRCWWAVSDVTDRDHVVRVAKNLTGVQDDPRCISVIAIADPLGQIPVTRRRLETMAATGVSDADQLRRLGMAARAVGADVLAADYFTGAESQLRERGQLALLCQVLAVQAAVYVDLGNWKRAGQSLEEGRLLSQETGQSTWRTGTAVVAAVLEGLTGATELALQHAAEIEAACSGEVAQDFRALVQFARGAAHLSAARPAEAYAALAPLFDPLAPCHHPREQLSALMLLVEAAVACGADDAVREVVARMETLARRTTAPIVGVHLLYARPVLAADDDAERLFQESLAHDLTRWPWPRARIELAYGNWLRRRRRLIEARVPLRSALATFDALGAREWGRQARTGLRAAGERITPTGADPDAPTLTVQERQIARLAADGLSNREIGQQLYLSPRTVGSHLYRIFPKLGITSRAQLATHLTDA